MKYLTVILFTKVRSSRPEVFYKKGVVEKETLAQNFAKFLRTPFLAEHLRRLLPKSW